MRRPNMDTKSGGGRARCICSHNGRDLNGPGARTGGEKAWGRRASRGKTEETEAAERGGDITGHTCGFWQQDSGRGRRLQG